MLKKVIQFNAGDFGVIAALGCALFAVLQLVINVVMLVVKPDTVPTLCGILLPIILGLILFMFFMSNLAVNFDFLLRCSVTRKRALGSLLVLLVLEAAEAVVISLLLTQVDRFIAQAWVRARPGLGIEEFSIPLWGVILGYAAVLLLGLVSGAALHRFGRKAFWVLWGVWMVLVLLMNSTDWWEALFHGAALAWFGGATVLALVLGIAAALAAVGWAVWTMLHACVKN